MNAADIDSETDFFNLAVALRGDAPCQSLICIQHYCAQFPDNDNGWLLQAIYLRQLCNFREAQAILNKIRVGKKASEWFLELYYNEWGMWHADQGEYDAAIVALDKAIASRPERALSYICKAEIFTKRCHNQAARDCLKDAIQCTDGVEDVWKELGYLFRAQLQLEESRKAFLAALDADPYDEQAALDLEDVDAAIELEAAIGSGGFSGDLYDVAGEFEDAGKVAQALVCITAYCAQLPKTIAGWLKKADILIDVSNFEEAHRALEEVKLSETSNAETIVVYWDLWGKWHGERKDFQSSFSCFDRAIAFAPNETGPRIFKGSKLASSGRYGEAIACHLEATFCEGDVDEAWLNIGMIRRAQMQLEEAREAFQKALAICPDYPDAVQGLKDVEGAMELIGRIRALDLGG